jgi:hypothetical protein
MSSQLLIETTGRVALVAIAIGTVAVAKALASVLRTWVEQSFRTRRLIKALEDTRPNQRPGIILACSELEGGAAGKRGQETAVELLPAEGRPWPPALVVQTKHDGEHHGE